MDQIILFPYKMGSEGSKALKKTIQDTGIKSTSVFPDRNYKPKTNHLIINWGNSVAPKWEGMRNARNVVMLNKPEAVRIASDKKLTFERLFDTEVRIPMFTTDKKVASQWFNEQQVDRVYCRTLLRSKGGKGIVIANNPNELVDAGLYVEGLPTNRNEYRAHVINGKCVDIAMRKRKGKQRLADIGQELNKDIRAYDNGWVFCREEVYVQDCVKQSAVDAVRLLGLDFGAVDIATVLAREVEIAYILEVNTAPGLQDGSTATNTYAKQFSDMLRGNI